MYWLLIDWILLQDKKGWKMGIGKDRIGENYVHDVRWKPFDRYIVTFSALLLCMLGHFPSM